MAGDEVVHDQDLAPTVTEGYQVGQAKTVEELAQLDKEDESLQRWKASLGLASSGSSAPKKVIPQTLFLESDTLPSRITIDLTDKDISNKLKENPVTIKEGITFSLGIAFLVEGQIVSGMKFIQATKRSGVTVDKIEHMIGSFGPSAQPVTKVFAAEESPSGMLARSKYLARSRIIDDDGTVWLDFSWNFKIAKEW